VDFDMLLQRMDQIFLEVVGRKRLEVDEPETDPASMIAAGGVTAADSEEQDDLPETINFDQMSEEELLAGIEGLVPPEKSDEY
ncbi:hypothetical protein ACC764_38800, partial [Rhizobium ruizarguesonis]